MKSRWKVSSQVCGDIKIYQVYRLRDVDSVDENGNRQYDALIFSDKREALNRVDVLNKTEANNDAEK